MHGKITKLSIRELTFNIQPNQINTNATNDNSLRKRKIFLFKIMGIPCPSPTRKFFTHMETSPSTVKGFKFWSLLGSRDLWAVTVLTFVTPIRDIRLYGSYPRTRDTHTCFREFGSGAVITCFYDLSLSRLVRATNIPHARRMLYPTALPPRLVAR